MPLVSIIIPIYNVENYLEACLASVISQSYPNIEIICVMDGSSDRSDEIAMRFAHEDQRVRLIHQTNQGLAVARNVGVAHSVGDFIFFLDSDDWLARDAIQNLLEIAVQNNCAVVSGSVTEFDEDTGKTKPYKRLDKRRVGRISLKGKDFFALEVMVWNKLYKREVAISVPFAAGLIHEDIDFYWRVFTQYSDAIAIAETVVFYRRRVGTLSNAKSYDGEYQNHYIRIVDNACKVVEHRADLKTMFQYQALRYLKYLREKNAPAEHYKSHIAQKYGIHDTYLYRFGLKVRRFLAT